MLSGVSRDEAAAMLSDLVEWRRRINSEEVRWAAVAAELAASGYHEVEGFATPVDMLRHRCQMGRGAVADRLCVGERMERLERSVDTAEQGEIGFSHLVAM